MRPNGLSHISFRPLPARVKAKAKLRCGHWFIACVQGKVSKWGTILDGNGELIIILSTVVPAIEVPGVKHLAVVWQSMYCWNLTADDSNRRAFFIG